MRDIQTAVICSAHFNAVGVAMSLREEGWQGRILCLKINSPRESLADRWPKLCECRGLTVHMPEDLQRAIAEHVPPENVGAVFFCDERFHEVFSDGRTAALFPNAQCWPGPRRSIDIVLDRWKFYDYLRAGGLANVPETVRNPCDPWPLFGDGFRARVWRSWRGMIKLPRGQTIRTRQQFDAWRRLCDTQGVSEEEWGCQELLCTAPQHTVSVCGWHDASDPLYLVTRWVRQRSENGWLVETVEDPGGLRDTTRRILGAMDYCGPFELEFVKNRRGDGYKVIELNPRFWMQHRLVGSELIRRYLGLPSISADANPRPRYWVNTDEFLKRFLTFRGFDLVPYLRQGRLSTPVGRSICPVLIDLAKSPWHAVRALQRSYGGGRHAR
jgi:hypothetical protein